MKIQDYIIQLEIFGFHGQSNKARRMLPAGNSMIRVGRNFNNAYLWYFKNDIVKYSNVEFNKDLVMKSAIMFRYLSRKDILSK